jgi:hypothetical protein
MTVQSQFARQIEHVAYLPRVQFIFEYQTEFTNAVESALRGTKTPSEALATAESNINAILSAQLDRIQLRRNEFEVSQAIVDHGGSRHRVQLETDRSNP